MPWITLAELRESIRRREASMRPRRNAVDNSATGLEDRLKLIASMRPRRNAVDNPPRPKATTAAARLQ